MECSPIARTVRRGNFDHALRGGHSRWVCGSHHNVILRFTDWSRKPKLYMKCSYRYHILYSIRSGYIIIIVLSCTGGAPQGGAGGAAAPPNLSIGGASPPQLWATIQRVPKSPLLSLFCNSVYWLKPHNNVNSRPPNLAVLPPPLMHGIILPF